MQSRRCTRPAGRTGDSSGPFPRLGDLGRRQHGVVVEFGLGGSQIVESGRRLGTTRSMDASGVVSGSETGCGERVEGLLQRRR